MVNITIVVGLDAKTLEQWSVSLPTLAKYRSEMFTWPWVLFYDWTQVSSEDIHNVASRHFAATSHCRAVPWPSTTEYSLNAHQPPTYGDQREKMLSGFVHVPARHVETPWWMKIDTDAVALGESDWLRGEWFTPDEHGQHNAWVSSPWSYSKPANAMAVMDDWGDKVPDLAKHPRLDIPWNPESKRVSHPRMASWLSFYHTSWTRWASHLASIHCGRGRIPIASQDGYHFYLAERCNRRYHRAKMKRYKWTNVPRLEKLKRVTSDALEGLYDKKCRGCGEM